ncbi:hypothetical protein [Chryseobacterium lactis]|nr:hypothetical protein [Chryseobacterium lactis]
MDTIIFWRQDHFKTSEKIISLSEVKKEFKISNGRLITVKTNNNIPYFKLVLQTDDFKGEDVEIRNGLPFGHYCDFTDGVTCRMDIHYDERGNMNGYFSVQNYNATFSKGNGYWKDFYSIKDKQVLKEEGKVKSNYKVGEWKYYDKEGKMDSIKTYTLKDAVDVRFPHCIFNKNEPCY